MLAFSQVVLYKLAMPILNAADRLSLLFISLLVLLSALFMPSPSGQIILYGILAVSLLGIGWVRTYRAGTNGFYIHVAFIVGMVLVLFNSMGTLVAAIRPVRYDQALIRIDYALFGVHPTVWMERMIHPVLTALLQLAYISYYVIPVGLGIVLIVKKKIAAFDRALFGIILCFYLSYIGYLLVPAVGPRFTLDHLQTRGLEAGPFTTLLQNTLNGLEKNKTDAFPSGHTAIALVTLYYAWLFKEQRLCRLYVPAVSLLILSTVYLRYHYVIDVLAGIVLAGLSIMLEPALGRWFSRRPAGHPGNNIHDGA